MLLESILLCVAVFLYFYLRFPREITGCPSVAHAWPLLGNIPQLADPDSMKAWGAWFKEYGPFVKLKLFSSPVLMVTDYTAALEIFHQSGKNFVRDVAFDADIEIFGRVLFADDGITWQKRRKILVPCFAPNLVSSSLIPFFITKIRPRLRTLLEKTPTCDVLDVLESCTLDFMCWFLMSEDCGHVLHKDIFHLRAFFKLCPQEIRLRFMLGNSKLITLLTRPLRTAFHRARKEMTQKLGDLVQKRRMAMTKPKNDEEDGVPQDVLFTMLKNGLTNRECVEELTGLLFAGQDTTTITTSCALFELTSLPQTQLDLAGEYAEWEASEELTRGGVLSVAVLKEALRLHTPATMHPARTIADVQIGPCFVPKDSSVYVNTYNLLRDPAHYPEAEKFIPDRFLHSSQHNYIMKDDLDAEVEKDSVRFLGFLIGRHSCIGRHVALNEGATLLGFLCHDFTISTSAKELHFVQGVVRRPTQVVLTFTPRKLATNSI